MIFCTTQDEKLSISFPAELSGDVKLIAHLWAAAKAALLTPQEGHEPATMPEAFAGFDTFMAELIEPPDDHYVSKVFFHRLTSDEQDEVENLVIKRGTIPMRQYYREVCLRAIDGWNEHVYKPVEDTATGETTLQRMPPPSGTRAERRAYILEVVSTFPPAILEKIAKEAEREAPDVLKKSWQTQLHASFSSRTQQLNMSSPAGIVEQSTGVPMNSHPVMMRDSTPVLTGN